MAGKITIRRIGSMLPTACLLLILALAFGILWFSTVGFPDAAVRYIEKRAAEQGICLRVGALKLFPSRGLAVRAENVQLFAQAGDEEPLLTAGAVSMGLNASHLMLGHVRPAFVQLNRGHGKVPVTDPAGKYLELSEMNIGVRFDRGESAQLTAGFVRVQGIPVRVQGSCDLDQLLGGESEASPELNLHELISARQETINKIYRHIHEQQWSAEQTPSLELRVALHDDFRASVRSEIPSFNIGQFHFRDAKLDLQYNGDTITINQLRFNTVDPDAKASLQGAYDVERRHLSFSMESTAALVRMARQMSDGALHDYLRKFRHPDDCPPHVEMRGDVCFEEDYTLQSARVRGSIEQKELSVGSTRVNTLQLSFFYDNGNFNIDKMELLFEDGSLQCMAAAQDGVGQAQLAADLPVQKVLTLVRELAMEEAALPEGLAVGDRVHLSAHARLTTPAFKPGQTHWQGFVPSFHMLALELRSDRMAYRGYALQEPVVQLQCSDIEQRRNLFLRAIGSASLRVKARQAVLSPQAGDSLCLEEPAVELSLDKISFDADSRPNGAGGVSLQAQAKSLHRPGEQPLALNSLLAKASLKQLAVDLSAGPDSLSAAALDSSIELDSADVADVHMGKLKLHLSNKRGAEPLPLEKLALTGELSAAAADLRQGETPVGNVSLHAALPANEAGWVGLYLVPQGEQEDKCHVRATLTLDEANNQLFLMDIEGEAPRSALSLIPALCGVQLQDVELPSRVGVRGYCTLQLDPLKLLVASLLVEMPDLVRTPWRRAVFKDKRVPLSILADVSLLAGRDSGFNYSVSLRAKHESGAFEGMIAGSTATSTLRVTGKNTIRPDIVDMLIDDEDAHSIIRDFRFPEGGHAVIDNIDARIDYSNGLKVDSVCRVELFHTEYLISVLEDMPDGGERLRNDLGSNPYTLVSHATCEVLVKVEDGCRAPDGSRLPDESIVTIRNAVLEYNNTPWLSRRGWKTGTRETKLEADTIIIDIERSFVELRHVRGKVYPAYSLGMFYPDLQHYLEDVILPSPVQVETPLSVFPIYSDCTRPMSGTIRVLSPGEAGFRFIGTTIPLRDFSGFVCLTDDYVQLDRLNAKSWEGVLDAAVKIGISGKRTSFDGYAKAQCMNLQKIAAAYDSKQAPALCSGEIRFRSPSPSLTDIKAYGHVDVEDGDLMTLSLFRPVSELISDLPAHFMQLEKQVAASAGRPEPKPGFFSRVFSGIFKGLGRLAGKTSDGVGRMASNVPGMNHLIAYDLQEAHTNFTISNGHFITQNMKVKGYNLNVSLDLDINLDTLELRGNLWPRISSLPTILLSPFTFLSDFMVDIILYGNVGDVKWRIGLDRRLPMHPASATSTPAPDSPKPRRPTR